MKGEYSGIDYKYSLKEMFAFKCVNCSKKRTFREFMFIPFGLCNLCDRLSYSNSLASEKVFASQKPPKRSAHRTQPKRALR